MTDRMEYQVIRRSRNRLVDEGFCKFAPDNIEKLKDKLRDKSDYAVLAKD